ncbi:MAG TPA: aminoglycoside phosphotransferase family protein [Burkholderiales bacterium]|jgi:fructosamine-3-kinase|nr:aminoglycoside phosphotransferase family protein [Burkholderiales bacterium]
MKTEPYLAALVRMGLAAPTEHPPVTPLAGGVSSDIYRVDLARGPVCIKRALPKLKVRADWRAPVERSRFESQWMKTAGAIVPDAVPRILGEDAQAGMFAMEFLPPAHYPVWKTQLRDGIIDAHAASEVGRRICRIHAGTAGRLDIARAFATDHIFLPIRLEPYLRATAAKHPRCAERLESLVRITLATKRALVHGDVSPKNILMGPRGPVFLDAECAWYGDPAFDLAFCLNHLLLKCVWRPQWTTRYLECFDALSRAYLNQTTWEPAVDIEARAAHLLPGLLLGRVDGKSPVEYITEESDRDKVRGTAIALLLHPVDVLAELRSVWREELSR